MPRKQRPDWVLDKVVRGLRGYPAFICLNWVNWVNWVNWGNGDLAPYPALKTVIFSARFSVIGQILQQNLIQVVRN